MADPAGSIYLVVPARLEHEILEPLRAHFAGDDRVEVIVERRAAERRPGVDDRILREAARAEGERRAQTVPRGIPSLPPKLRRHARELRVIQRLAPVRAGLEGLDVLEVVRLAQEGHPDAPTELYWRTYQRVSNRLGLRLRDREQADRAVKGTFGHIFDRIGDFDAAETALPAWLDRMVDEHVETLPRSA